MGRYISDPRNAGVLIGTVRTEVICHAFELGWAHRHPGGLPFSAAAGEEITVSVAKRRLRTRRIGWAAGPIHQAGVASLLL